MPGHWEKAAVPRRWRWRSWLGSLDLSFHFDRPNIVAGWVNFVVGFPRETSFTFNILIALLITHMVVSTKYRPWRPQIYSPVLFWGGRTWYLTLKCCKKPDLLCLYPGFLVSHNLRGRCGTREGPEAEKKEGPDVLVLGLCRLRERPGILESFSVGIFTFWGLFCVVDFWKIFEIDILLKNDFYLF